MNPSIYAATRIAEQRRHTLRQEVKVAALLREAHTADSPKFKPLQVSVVAQFVRLFGHKPTAV